MSIIKIAMATHHTRKKIMNYLNPQYSTVSGHYDRKRYRKVTAYEQDILKMRSIGKTYNEIFQCVKAKGYKGSIGAIKMFVQKERTHAQSSNFRKGKEYIHRTTLSQLVYQKLEDVKAITPNQYEALLKRHPKLAELYGLVREFHRAVFSKNLNSFIQWI